MPSPPTNTSQPSQIGPAYPAQTFSNQAVPPYPATYESTMYDPSAQRPAAQAWGSAPARPTPPPVQVYPSRDPQPPPARKGRGRILIPILILAVVLVISIGLGGGIAY